MFLLWLRCGMAAGCVSLSDILEFTCFTGTKVHILTFVECFFCAGGAVSDILSILALLVQKYTY